MSDQYIIVDIINKEFFKDDNGDTKIFESYDDALTYCGFYEFENVWICKLMYNYQEDEELSYNNSEELDVHSFIEPIINTKKIKVTMINKQSSIQQFWDKIALKLSVDQINEFLPLFKQAKAKHNEEMVDFLKWTEGVYSFGNVLGLWYEHINTERKYTTEQLYNKYYNETFGGNK